VIVVIDGQSRLTTRIVDYKIKTKKGVPQSGEGR
jgi:hypothetical protein